MNIKNIDTKASNILAIVYRCKVLNALKNILERIRQQQESFQAIKNMADMLDMSVEEYSNQLICFNDGSAFPICELLDKMSDLYNNDLLPQQDISSLKKRIKYCKNPMEKKKLQQELNVLYKEQKRRK